MEDYSGSGSFAGQADAVYQDPMRYMLPVTPFGPRKFVP